MARTDNLTNYLTDVASAIKEKKGDMETPIPANKFDDEIRNLQGGGGIVPRNVNFTLKINPDSIGLKWEDPDDTLNHEGELYCKWQGSKVLYREGNEYMLDENDGIEVLDNKEKNSHSEEFLMINNLKAGQKYCFSIFPYSDKDSYNINEANSTIIAPSVMDFNKLTDEQLAEMLDLHYKGIIDVADHWHVGDTRVMHLSAMTSGTGGEAHVEQDMTMVIVAINHDDLKEQIGVRKKAAVTLQCREILGNKGSTEPADNKGGTGQWASSPRRTWLNNNFAGSLPTGIQSLLKTVIKKNLKNHVDNTAGDDTEDKVFFPSYPEMFGSASFGNYKGSPALEGEQYPYYNSDIKRTKYINDNGAAGANKGFYWLRSPSSGGSERWCDINDTGGANSSLSSTIRNIAPAFCL